MAKFQKIEKALEKATLPATLDEKLWGLALAFTREGECVASHVNGETVLSLPGTDYVVAVGPSVFFVETETGLYAYESPEHCPNLPDELMLFLEERIDIASNLANVELWELFVEVVNSLDEDELAELEEIIGEIW